MKTLAYTLPVLLASSNAVVDDVRIATNKALRFSRRLSSSRTLRVDPKSETYACLTKTLSIGNPFETLASLLDVRDDAVCDPACDFAGTEAYAQSTALCDGAGGRIVDHEIAVCGEDRCDEDVGCAGGKVPPTVYLEHVPLCLHRDCEDGDDFIDMVKFLVKNMDEDETEEIEEIPQSLLEGKCAREGGGSGRDYGESGSEDGFDSGDSELNFVKIGSRDGSAGGTRSGAYSFIVAYTIVYSIAASVF